MMRPVAVFVGLRYLRSQRTNSFASFVSIASVIGVALGVAALIVVLSVMNGFENELRGRLLSLAGHASIQAPAWRDALDDLLADPRFTAAEPFVDVEAMLSSGRDLSGAWLTGIDPETESSVSEVRQHMRVGSLEDLRPGENGIVLGRALALRLNVRTGDAVTVMVPRRSAQTGLTTGLRQFVVVGIFELGLRDHDGVRALVHLDDAVIMSGRGSQGIGIRVKTQDPFAAPGAVRAWAADWAARNEGQLRVRDWTQDNATYFRAIRIEKIMMMLLLSLIVCVAVFNIVATLVMVVTDKRGGIAILRTLGYSRRMIGQIFAFQGVVVGWIGVIVGVIAGIGLTLNVDTLAPRLEQVFGFEFMPADVYYLTALPADLHGIDVLVVVLLALLMTALATVYPAVRAAGVAPAEVLRYE